MKHTKHMNLTKNTILREAIIGRLKELGMSYSELLKDAAERGMKIAPARMSKYVKNKYGGMTEEQLLWVATRLGIYINLNLGKITMEGGKPTFKITPLHLLHLWKLKQNGLLVLSVFG